MEQPYNIYYDNRTGRVVLHKNERAYSPNRNNRNPQPNNDFDKKIEELYNYTNINSPNQVSIGRDILNNKDKEELKKSVENQFEKINKKNDIIPQVIFDENNEKIIIPSKFQNDKNNQTNLNENIKYLQEKIIPINLDNKENAKFQEYIKNQEEQDKKNKEDKEYQKYLEEKLIQKNENIKKNNKEYETNRPIIIKKDLVYGIKKTILSDFNYLNNSSNCNDFKIGINKSNDKNDNVIYDTFYLFPNISEINTKSETNIVNEKKVLLFNNKNDKYDKQYFPIDFVPCGISIPLKYDGHSYKKIIIKNLYWNIFQSIDSKNYENDELLCVTTDVSDFVYKKIKLQINIELHSQLSLNTIENYSNHILQYRNENIKNSYASNTCLYKALIYSIDTLNGSNFDNLEIDLLEELDIKCALLCIKISVPDECLNTLKGYDKYNKSFYGYIPFSQFILNFDYEVL